MSQHTVANGADLQSKVATNGTVRLHADHENVTYYIDLDFTYVWSDYLEIRDYLADHDFELMDADECEPELMDGFTRVWACHSYGDEFGSAAVPLLVGVTAFIAASVPVIHGFMRFGAPLMGAA